jgi:hypothetical protein
VLGAAPEEDAARLHEVFVRVGGRASDGRLTGAARGFVAGLAEHGHYIDEDMDEGATSGLWEASGENLPTVFREMEQAGEARGPDPADPTELSDFTVPVLRLPGARSHPLNFGFVRHRAWHPPEPHVRGVDGAGQCHPHTRPEVVGRELVRFFDVMHHIASDRTANLVSHDEEGSETVLLGDLEHVVVLRIRSGRSPQVVDRVRFGVCTDEIDDLGALVRRVGKHLGVALGGFLVLKHEWNGDGGHEHVGSHL